MKAFQDFRESDTHVLYQWVLLSALVILDRCGLLCIKQRNPTELAELGGAFLNLFSRTTPAGPHSVQSLKREIGNLLAPYEGTGHPLGVIPAALRDVSVPKRKGTADKLSDQALMDMALTIDLGSVWRQASASAEALNYATRVIFETEPHFNELVSKTLPHAKPCSVIDLCARGGQIAVAFAGACDELCLYEKSPCLAIIATARVLIGGQQVDRLKVHIGSPPNVGMEQRKWDVVIAVPPLESTARQPSGPGAHAKFDLGYFESAMDHLQEGGNSVVLLPHCELFSKRSHKLRRRLLENFRVDCVVHEASDESYVVADRSALVYFTKSKPARRIQMIFGWDYYELFNIGSAKDDLQRHCFIEATQAFLSGRSDGGTHGGKSRLRESLQRLEKQAMDLLESLEHTTIPKEDLPIDVQAASAALRLVIRAVKCLDGDSDPIDEASYREQPLVAEAIDRGCDLRYPRYSVANYNRFLEEAEKKHNARILTLDQIGVIHSGKNCPTIHLRKAKSTIRGSQARVVRVVTARNDRGNNNRKLELVELETALVPEVAAAVPDDELLRDGDILVTLVGNPGKITKVRDVGYDLMDNGILVPAVATNRHAIIRLHDSFKSALGGGEMVANLLATQPYQEAFSTLSVGGNSRRINVTTLGQFKIPILPPEKRLMLDLALEQEEPSIETMLGALDKGLISADAIHCFTRTSEWRHFSERAATAQTEDLRSRLGTLVTIHAREVLDRKVSQNDPFSEWIRQFMKVAEDLEAILRGPHNAEQILSILQWRRKLAEDNGPYQRAWNTFDEAVRLDPEQIRDAVLNHCRAVIDAILTLSRRCERDLMQEMDASQERDRLIYDFWEISRGLALREADLYALPLLLMLAKEPRIHEALEKCNRNAFGSALYELMSRSRTHQTAVQWFEKVQNKIDEPRLWEIIEKGRNLWVHQGESGMDMLVLYFLQQIPRRGLSMQGVPTLPAEAMTFMVAVAELTPPGQVYVPYAPGYGFSKFLPVGVEGYFQFQSEQEAGIFAIHEMAAGRYSQFEISDPTTNWKPFGKRFDGVIAMPPFNQRISRTTDPVELVCIRNALSEVAQRGKAIICVTPGFLMKRDRVREFRKQLATEGKIEAVVQLPPGLLGGSSIAISLLVLRNSGHKMKSVRFIDAMDCVVPGQRNLSPLLDLAELQKRWHDESHHRCRSVDFEELERKEFDLTPARYLVSKIVAPENHTLIPLGDVIRRIRFPRCQPGDKGIPLGPGAIPTIGSLDPVSFVNREVVDAEGLTHPEVTSRVNKNVLIINSMLSKGDLAACLFEYKGKDLFLLSQDMLTFEVKTELVDVQWLLLALGSELTKIQIDPLIVGTGIPRVRPTMLLDILLAVPNQKSQQKDLVALHKESLMKSRAKEIGLEGHIQSIKKGFLDDLRLKKHSISQITNEIKSAIAVISDELAKHGSIAADQIISRRRSIDFGEYLQGMSRKCEKLGDMVESLTVERKFEPLAPLDLGQAMERLVKEYQGEDFELKFGIDKRSFVDPITGHSIKPIIKIGANDFQSLCRNIIDNAKRHAFKNDFKGASILVDAELLQEEQLIELCFMNNGAPFPKDMDLERFVLRGEKAGSTGNTGTGGYHIKSIMDYVGGHLDICSPPFDEYSTEIRLFFPIYHDDTL